jgi:DNA polymerase-3 subunit beta
MTAFTVARKALAPAVARAAAIVPEKTTIPIIQCVLIETSSEGLFAGATDTELAYRERIDAEPREPWRGCVNAGPFEAFVTGLRGDGDVSLRPDDEGRLRIRSGRASCRLPLWPADDFPVFSQRREGASELTFDAEALATGLRTVAPAMSTETSRAYLCGAFLHSGRLAATDGNRITLHTLATDDSPPAPDVIIPGGTATKLIALLRGVDGELSVIVSETQIAVGTSQWTLTSKLVDGTYPEYRRVIPERLPAPLLVQRAELRKAAALITSVHQGDKTRGLHLTAKGNELLVASEANAAQGTCEVVVPIEIEPPAVSWSIGLNPKYLISALDAIDAELVEIHVTPQSPVWLCAPGEANDGTAIMTMRL